MKLRQNILAYHVNDEKRCKNFVNNKEYLINSEDKKWLGYGMYFWDNEVNASYWVEQKKRKETHIKKIAKVKCNVFLDRLLDLTDTAILDTFNVLWEQYCEKEKCSTNQPLGIKLDKIFDFFGHIDDTFKVIRVYGQYKKTPKSGFMEYVYSGRHKNHDRPVGNIKCIYSVRDAAYATNRILMEVLENEKYKCG